MARRTAGRLGDNGFVTQRGIFLRPRPTAAVGETEVLQAGKGGAGDMRA